MGSPPLRTSPPCAFRKVEEPHSFGDAIAWLSAGLSKESRKPDIQQAGWSFTLTGGATLEQGTLMEEVTPVSYCNLYILWMLWTYVDEYIYILM